MGLAISLLTIFLCFCVRHFDNLRSWWTRHWYIGDGLLGVGFLLYVLSRLPEFRETVPPSHEETGWLNTSAMAPCGWFLIAFSLLHAYLSCSSSGKKAA